MSFLILLHHVCQDLLSRHQADDAKDELDFFGKKDSNAKDQKIIKDKSDPRKGNKRKILNGIQVIFTENGSFSSKMPLLLFKVLATCRFC